jgi:hypothetical protein
MGALIFITKSGQEPTLIAPEPTVLILGAQ